MPIEQPYALRFTRHAAQDLDAMFQYITYEWRPRRPPKR